MFSHFCVDSDRGGGARAHAFNNASHVITLPPPSAIAIWSRLRFNTPVANTELRLDAPALNH